jgi:fructokinase
MPEVVFVDRVSPGAIALAEAGFERGALVCFEPSAKCDSRLAARMLAVTHILKYSEDHAQGFMRTRLCRVPLEIETLGVRGLRYRGILTGKRPRSWQTLPSFVVPHLRDAAGAGDWLTAGFIDYVARAGAAGIEHIPRDIIEEGLRTGQAFAAWACGFEGARGGMYRQDITTVRGIVRDILSLGCRKDAPLDVTCDPPFDVLKQLCGGCGPALHNDHSTQASIAGHE